MNSGGQRKTCDKSFREVEIIQAKGIRMTIAPAQSKQYTTNLPTRFRTFKPMNIPLLIR